MHARSLTTKDSLFDQKRVLTKAFIRMTQRLALSRREISIIIGLSEPSLSRIFNQDKFFIDPVTKEGQLAILLLRLYRSLDTLFGGNGEQYQTWLRSNNQHLQAIPIELIQSIEGLVLVVQYLDTMRGKS